MTVEEKLDKLQNGLMLIAERLIKFNDIHADNPLDPNSDISCWYHNMKARNPKPEPDKWWVSGHSNEAHGEYYLISFGEGPPFKKGRMSTMLDRELNEFVKHLRPDLTLPEPGEVIEIPAMGDDGKGKVIMPVEVSLALQEKVHSLKKQNQKMREWIESIKMGVGVDFLDSLDEVTND